MRLIILFFLLIGYANAGCHITPVNGHVTWDLQNNGTSIPYRAFRYCDNLVSITIPEGVLSIGESGFQRCDNLMNVSLPTTLTTFGAHAFLGCASLEEIVIPENVKRLPWQLFMMCTKLSSVTLPDGLLRIGGLDSVAEATADDKPMYSTHNHYEVDEGGVFHACTSLISINIPDSVTFIARNSFENTGLTHIDIPPKVTFLHGSLFHGSPLQSVNIPNGVTHIGHQVFHTTQLTDIDIPDSVVYIDGNVFVGTSIKTLIARGITQVTTISNYPVAGDGSGPDAIHYIVGGSPNFFGYMNVLESTIILPNVATFSTYSTAASLASYRLFLPTATSVEFDSNAPLSAWCPHNNGTQCTFNYDANVPLDGRINALEDVPQPLLEEAYSQLSANKLKALYKEGGHC